MNSFTIYPAIDLRRGRVVRLREGDPARQTTYGDDPAQVAEKWLGAGAQWLHVVNLDGAFDENDTVNRAALHIILDVAKRLGARVQFGGGLRSLDMVRRALNLGVSRVVLGTIAIEQPQLVTAAMEEFGAEKIAVGIDARDGYVRVRGWQSNSGILATDLAHQMHASGVHTIVFTDISRDGIGSGLNIPSTRALADATGLDVIASGGVHTLNDVIAAQEANLAGVIIGRALYEGTIDLKEALKSKALSSPKGTRRLR
ncbi:MAG TPA: 1-(5-phosphoribosyl)-5-[(5-phosphoribosylamino)methylideneamino]imidazole-4-carboxamide isomerase [Anaerolineales bacterium]|nr:1-(5-phosphoribosyl)-5-[(5-phosphoribosylamino)methylideneamino]imidazole-4-carboxamide isomerase [Anaerolineales bacterium]